MSEEQPTNADEPAIVQALRAMESDLGGWLTPQNVAVLLAFIDSLKASAPPAASDTERAFFEKFEDIAVRIWSSDAAALRGKIDNHEAWALNTARQHGWKGETVSEAWDYLDLALEQTSEVSEERDRLRAELESLKRASEELRR